MIDRSDVLHIARLSRLTLGKEEVSRMAVELSSVLDHIAKMNELELDDVEGTSHVLTVENVLRGDEPAPGIDRDLALREAPDVMRQAFRVPSPVD